MPSNELLALIGAVTLGTLALLHALVWRVQRQRASALFALTMALGVVFYSFYAQLMPVGGRAHPLGSLIGAVALVLLTLGMVEYVALPPAWLRRIWLGVIGVAALLLALLLGGWMSRLGGVTAYAAFFLFQAGLAGWALRHEPGRGHGLVLIALLLYPAAVAAAALGYVELQLLRYFVVLPTAVLGMTVLTTGLLRARRDAEHELKRRRGAEEALRALNESLELRVAQRTAELSDMVAGLESFSRNVSHDLRGPLGGIAAAARLAAEALDAGQLSTVRRYLPAIQAQAESSAELVTALLALARVGKAELAPRPLDAAQVVAD